MSAVLVQAGRHGGYVFLPRQSAPLLSDRARRLGLETREDVEREYHDQHTGWSLGTEWHCPFCDAEFCSPSGARKHMQTQGHPVLRVDWYGEDAQ